jgi:hypothetical protein
VLAKRFFYFAAGLLYFALGYRFGLRDASENFFGHNTR